jgi:hypothetical protein
MLAEGGQAVGAERVGLGPGPGGVDHRSDGQVLLAVGSVDAQHEGELVPAWAADLVEALAGDADHPVVELDPAGDRGKGGQRKQVAVEQVAAGGQLVRVRRRPAGGGQQPHSGRVKGQAPRAEQAHVPPVGEVGTDLVSRLQHRGLLTPGEQVGGGGQTDRAGADDGNGEAIGGHNASLP